MDLKKSNLQKQRAEWWFSEADGGGVDEELERCQSQDTKFHLDRRNKFRIPIVGHDDIVNNNKLYT